MNSNYTIEYSSKLDPTQMASVWQILCNCDNEFVPPLSYRLDTAQLVQKTPIETDYIGPIAFFQDMLAHEYFFLLYHSSKNTLVGFLSIIENFDNAVLPEYSPSIYISTVCILEEHRRHGLSRELYRALFAQYGRSKQYTVRTWTQNISHRCLLDKLHFQIIKVFPNERGPGVDTIYYGCF